MESFLDSVFIVFYGGFLFRRIWGLGGFGVLVVSVFMCFRFYGGSFSGVGLLSRFF